VGDWGWDGAFKQREVAAQMGSEAARSGSKFVISVGDNFYQRGVESAADPHFRSSFEDIYVAPSLQTPW